MSLSPVPLRVRADMRVYFKGRPYPALVVLREGCCLTVKFDDNPTRFEYLSIHDVERVA